MIILDRGAVKIAEVWFGGAVGDDEPATAASDGDSAAAPADRRSAPDLIQYVQLDAPYSGTKCTPFSTILVDLSQSEEELLAAMKKDARYAARRAEDKDQAACSAPAPAAPETLERFRDFYDRFAAQKGLSLLDRAILGSYAGAGALFLSSATAPPAAPPAAGPSPGESAAAPHLGEDLVWHAYFCHSRRARLLYSASLFRDRDDSAFRQMAGRVNRLLHVRDIMSFKSQGFATYDLGGWYDGRGDEEKLRINKFKEEFGGRLVTGYNCLRPVTLKGRLYLTAKGILKR